MGNFKMICLDIDGTLLNSKHQITDKTKEVIKYASNEKQIPVILVSARMPKGILFLQEELEISQPIICYSGSLVMDKNKNILFNKSISIPSMKKIYEATEKFNVHLSVYKDDQWYIEEMDPWAKQESDITKIIPNINKFDILFDLWDKENSGANKLLIMAEPDEITKIKEAIRDDSLNIYQSKTTYLEIMPKEASKTSAIEFLKEKFHISQNEIIAMGDNYNDIDMIEYAGLGIAMGNAPDVVKQSANEITLTNDEDGVAEAIKKYVF